MKITFRAVSDFEGWDGYSSFIQELIKYHSSTRICEIGAGANPALSADFVKEHGLRYEAIDKSGPEADKSGMDKMSIFDICADNCKLPGAPYDFICSRMTAEHFEHPRNAYANMFESLAPGGFCVHSFATLYALPFLINRLVPELASDFLLHLFSPRDCDKHAKFKAYYRNCRGPVKSNIRFFQDIGYEVLEYRGYFGHSYYHHRLPILYLLEIQKMRLLLRLPLARLTSYSTIILRRPSNT